MVREPLSQERIVDAAAAVADRRGLHAVSMRTVAAELGVEAMSLYHHIANKNELLDALADWVFTRMEVPRGGQPWRAAMAERAVAQRRVLAAHPWALGLTESRRHAGPAVLRHHDAVLGLLFEAGFPVALAGHAFSLLDAYVFGFVLTEVNVPMEHGVSADELVAELPLAQYPHLARFAAERVVNQNYHYGEEFEVGLELVLDALDDRLAAARHANARPSIPSPSPASGE